MFENQSTGVSPVVGVILMVAVTVILSAVVGTFVFELTGQTPENANNIGVDISRSTGQATVEVVTGTTDALEVRVDGYHVRTLSNASAGDSVTVAAPPDADISLVSVTNGESSVVTKNTGSETSSPIPTEALVAYYPLDEDSKSTIADYSASGFDGTTQNGVVLDQPGVIGSSVHFNGGDEHIAIGDHDGLIDGESAVTVSVWVKASSVDSTNTAHGLANVAFGKSGDGGSDFPTGDDNFELGLTNTSKPAVYIDNGSHITATGATSVSTGTWHHLVAVFNGSELSIYLNGSHDGSVAASGSFINSATHAHISGGHDFDSVWNGDVDQVRVYHRALNRTEIQQLYTAEQP